MTTTMARLREMDNGLILRRIQKTTQQQGYEYVLSHYLPNFEARNIVIFLRCCIETGRTHQRNLMEYEEKT